MALPRGIPALLAGLGLLFTFGSARAEPKVVINRVALTPPQAQALGQQLGARLQPGRYWYDHLSGAWGFEGGPAQGLLPPGLPVPGQLWFAASGGQTPVVVNGRALHPVDLQRLQQAGIPVRPGRFWLRSDGVGGLEGGPPSFNLRAMLAGAGGGRTRSGPFSTYDLTGAAVLP
jgi:hypothetical protein